MDSTPVKRSVDSNCDFANQYFKPIWEPDTAVGGNAVRYSLVHHFYQLRISNAGLCDFCTDELTRRVCEAARRLKARGSLPHDDRAFMELFWQNASGALVAGETLVTTDGEGDKIAVADHIEELVSERAEADPRWWHNTTVALNAEIGAMDRSEACPPRGAAWFACSDSGLVHMTPWQTRLVGLLWQYTLHNVSMANVMTDFVGLQEKYLSYTHESCTCDDIQRLRNGVSFDTVLLKRVMGRIGISVWELIPPPPENIQHNKRQFLTWFEERERGIQISSESVCDYAYSRGEASTSNSSAPRPLPQGWQRRWVFNNIVWHYNHRGRLISPGEQYPISGEPPAAEMPTIDEEEDLIGL